MKCWFIASAAGVGDGLGVSGFRAPPFTPAFFNAARSGFV
jgi:hypothetical protein